MKKLKALFIVLVMVLVLGVSQSIVLASDTLILNIDDARPFSDDNDDGQINDRYVLVSPIMHKVFKIGEQETENASQLSFSKALYCLRYGLGFGHGQNAFDTGVLENITGGESGGGLVDQYDINPENATNYSVHYDMKTQANAIIDYYETLSGSPDLDHQYTVDGKNFTPYNSILWLIDNMAIITENQLATQSSINQLLTNAGINNSVLTVDDVDVVQGITLWYFSNYDQAFLQGVELGNVLKLTTRNYGWATNPDFIEDFPAGRINQIETLFNYLVNTAIENGATRPNNNLVLEPTVNLDETLSPAVEKENITVPGLQSSSYYVVGPFKINMTGDNNWNIQSRTYSMGYKNSINQNSYTSIDIQGAYLLEINDSGTITNYDFQLQKNKKFYVAIPENKINGSIIDFKLDVSFDFSRDTRTGTLWLSSSTQDQPVLQIAEDAITTTKGSSITVYNRKPDFALRKYITAVNGVSLTTSREPNIDTSTILSNGTATYKHLKKAVKVKKDDIVTYTISVYNEGNIDGKVTKIVDHLPQGLALDSATTNTLANGKYTCVQNGNDITITINDSASNLSAFTGDSLSSYSIRVACKVTREQSANNQVLTNIAEISEVEVEGNEEDSTPGNLSVPANLSSYWGHDGQTSTTPGATNPGSYYAGQEDDDDFEKIEIEGVRADFALRKYITKVERDGQEVEIDSRVPVVNTAPLINNDDTAEYQHYKKEVEVQPGDIVTYAIRVYNEGQVPGRVTEIIDHVPNGLTLNEEKTNELKLPDNYNYAYTVEANGDIKISLNGNENLSAFDGGNSLSKRTIEIAFNVTEPQGDKDKVLTNVAEIYTYVTEPQSIPERDSLPRNFSETGNLSEYWGAEGQNANNPGSTHADSYYAGQEDDDDFEKVFIKGANADFALRKYITAVDGEKLLGEESRVPVIDISKIKPTRGEMNRVTTATYKHLKNPVIVKSGSKVEYTLAVYNEGDVSGRVTEITDYLPEGLEFDPTSNPKFIAAKGSYTASELENYDYSYQIIDNKLIIRFLEDYTLDPLTSTSRKLDSKEVKIICKVTAIEGNNDQVLTNIATISEYTLDNVADNIRDRDSQPETITIPQDLSEYWGHNGQTAENPGATSSESYYLGQQDDDDFEKIIIKGVNFDLALRKYISSVKRNGKEVSIESREPVVDVSNLNGGRVHTASYTHPKIDEPVVVKNGDIITYTIRVYNEGDVDGYVNSILDHIPEGLEFIVDSETNTKYLWEYKQDQTSLKLDTVSTSYWSKARTDAGKVDGLIHAYDGGDTLDYKDVEIEFKVTAPNTFTDNIVNIAEIGTSKAVNENNDELSIIDGDSPRPVNIDDYDLQLAPANSTYQEDDDDYEVIQLRFFDLALRKFITAVNDTEITGRVPEAVYNEEKDRIEYVHPKTPVEVSNADLVEYTIRVYNEGTIDGYAELISDDIPLGLVFVPENETNREYRWKMFKANGEETNNVSEAVRVSTDYLSEAHGEDMMNEEDEVNPNMINAYDPNSPISNVEPYNPDFRDVKIVFQIDESEIPEDRVVINHAQISDDSDDDEDSTPDEWIDTDDDQDIEKVYVRIFDLSLQKWVTQTIVTVDGETTVTETGFGPNVGLTEQDGRPNSENEPIAQVVIDKKKLDSTVVKFVYAIRVANEGEIAGYATEITDYIPEGLSFVEEDNPLWTKVGENKIITHALEQSLLEPGESATLEVVFTWINNENNFGVKTNIAAITEDYNDAGNTPDIDSTPGNTDVDNYNKEQEDDDDYALVVLTLKTGGEMSYIVLGLVVLTIIATGTLFIKRYAL